MTRKQWQLTIFSAQYQGPVNVVSSLLFLNFTEFFRHVFCYNISHLLSQRMHIFIRLQFARDLGFVASLIPVFT